MHVVLCMPNLEQYFAGHCFKPQQLTAQVYLLEMTNNRIHPQSPKDDTLLETLNAPMTTSPKLFRYDFMF